MTYHNGPRIVTNGLVLHLDAGNSKSYPGSGTVWSDLSGNNNHGTLTNGPSYNAANKGSIVLDGANDYINIANIGNYTAISYSLECFVFPTFDFGQFGRAIMSKTSACNSAEFVLEYGRTTNKFSFVLRDDLIFYSNNTYPKNIWHHVMVTRNNTGGSNYTNILYINGKIEASSNTNFFGTGGSAILSIGVNLGCTGIGYFTGRIGLSRVYSRALSATEVAQNYNALKGRYNL